MRKPDRPARTPSSSAAPAGRPTPPMGPLWLLGVAQAVGFFLGALLGRGLGLWLGFDAFGAGGYSSAEMVGIVLVGLGGGGGVQLARWVYVRRYGRLPG